MAETAERLGIADPAALRGLDLKQIAAANPRSLPHMSVVPGAVERALGPLPGKLRNLKMLCNVNAKAYQPAGAVARWARVLRGQGSLSDQDLKTLDAARTLVSSSMRAWSELAAEPDDDARRAGLETLAENTSELLSKTGPEGTRSAFMPEGAPPEQGMALGKSLLAAGQIWAAAEYDEEGD
jgi:hypothetical protein